MSGFFASDRLVDVVLVVLAIEVVALSVWHRRSGAARGRVVTAIVAVLPGAFLLLALRAALSGADLVWVVMWLTASFPAHLADLWRRPAI